MNNLKIFESSDFREIRVFDFDGEPWFVGKDICRQFGDTNHNRTLSRVDGEDKKSVKIKDSIGRMQTAIAINESGLYSILFSMQPQKANSNGVSDAYPIEVQERLDKIRRFKHWVTSEVLPSIRKHGVYAVDELLDNPDMAIKAFSALKEEREKNKALLEDNQRMRPKEIFADAVSASHTSILVGDLAKLINQNGVDIGAKRLFVWLRENGYLIKRKGTDYNLPTQKSMDLGLFEIKETAISHSDGHTTINRTPKVTGKGQNYFVNKFLGEERSA